MLAAFASCTVRLSSASKHMPSTELHHGVGKSANLDADVLGAQRAALKAHRGQRACGGGGRGQGIDQCNAPAGVNTSSCCTSFCHAQHWCMPDGRLARPAIPVPSPHPRGHARPRPGSCRSPCPCRPAPWPRGGCSRGAATAPACQRRSRLRAGAKHRRHAAGMEGPLCFLRVGLQHACNSPCSATHAAPLQTSHAGSSSPQIPVCMPSTYCTHPQPTRQLLVAVRTKLAHHLLQRLLGRLAAILGACLHMQGQIPARVCNGNRPGVAAVKQASLVAATPAGGIAAAYSAAHAGACLPCRLPAWLRCGSGPAPPI